MSSNIDDIEWFELEPGFDFDDSDIDGERAVRAWSPDVDLAAGSNGTVYQLDDGRFVAEGNLDFSDLRTLGYFDNIEDAKQAVIDSMETDGWLPYYNDINNIPSKHTGPLPTRKMSSMRKAINMNYRYAEEWNPDDYLPYDSMYGVHHSNDEKFAMAVVDAFNDKYGDEFEYLDGGQGDPTDSVEAIYETNSPAHLFVYIIVSHNKCRIAYAADDVNNEDDADVIRLNSRDPAKAADMIYDTIESYIDEIYR